jgi:hypothetical protein
VQRIPLPRIRVRAEPPPAVVVPEGRQSADRIDVEYACRRSELAGVALAVSSRLGGLRRQIGSPEELRLALIEVLGAKLDEGSLDVRRMPPALHTNEYWHVSLTGVSVDARADMDRLVEEARFVR